MRKAVLRPGFSNLPVTNLQSQYYFIFHYAFPPHARLRLLHDLQRKHRRNLTMPWIQSRTSDPRNISCSAALHLPFLRARVHLYR